ncbi:Mu-like prophage major head subunit gpT family protein [Sediminispirochaeta bajacaliforniensis]|uniref:Mu-like prophage major head subunit gpT family protein n=1 Tax=Sediminispirochaeta bajacaliforniensis TaxID=148 RepID=UPI0003612E7F|nr:Mu-like prophage major head subunit gpT family protein [Sediminispirochaeta bajacaliforniensis]
MIITNETLSSLRTMVRGEFQSRLTGLKTQALYKTLVTIIQSNSSSNTYGWLGKFPQMIEWVGERVIKDMKEMAYELFNKKYEATLGIDRADIEDDNLGIYRTLSQSYADEFVSFCNRKVFALLSGGFEGLCYDGQPFFDAEHPVYPNTDGTGTAESVSNIQGDVAATGTPWFLVNLSGVLKPFILQERIAPEMESITDTKNDHVFMNDEYLYGIRYRGNFGYGFWQQAVASKETLNAENYKAAVAKMKAFKRDGGDKLGIVPTHLVVGSSLESAGREVVEKENLTGGESNINYHTTELVVSPWME